MKVAIAYCSNYNGTTVSCDDVTEAVLEQVAEKIEEKVADKFHSDCDDSGYFNGDIAEVEAFCIAAVKEAFGDAEVEVTFTEDSSST